MKVLCTQDAVLLHVKEKVKEHSVSTPVLSMVLKPLASLHITEEFMDDLQLHFDKVIVNSIHAAHLSFC